MQNLQEKLQKLINEKEELKDKKYDIEDDPTLEPSDKRTRLAILDFNIQELSNAIEATKVQIRGQEINLKNEEYLKQLDKQIREEEEKNIIPKIYLGDVNHLKRLQIQQEKEHQEIRDRAKRIGTTVNEERLKEQRRFLNTKIYNDLKFLATSDDRKRELTKIFNIRF